MLKNFSIFFIFYNKYCILIKAYKNRFFKATNKFIFFDYKYYIIFYITLEIW